jgi:hypothetical protein
MNVRSWIQYFDSNQGTYAAPDWEAESSIAEGPARALLVRSLGVFQLGETGEGRTLMRYAARLRGRPGFKDYDHALGQLIAEEGVHASLLAKTLRHLGGDTVQHQWSDAAFTFVRRLINLEFEI